MELTTPTGKTFTLTLTASSAPGCPRLHIEMPEAKLSGTATGPALLKTPTKGATHYLLVGKAGVGITAETAQQITDAIAAYKADWQATAEGQFNLLCKQREEIGYKIAGACDAMEAAREKAFDSDTGAGWDKANAYRTEAEQYQAQLAEFDAAHPEVIAKIKAERAEKVERFLAND